jgi:hypothetical protein
LGQAVTAPERTLIKYTARPFAIPFRYKHQGSLWLLFKRVLVTGIKTVITRGRVICLDKSKMVVAEA